MIGSQGQLFGLKLGPKLRVAKGTLRQWFVAMTAIAEQLDAKLNSLDAKAASSLEKLVRDALEMVEASNGISRSDRLPLDFFSRIAREFGSEPFERPPQGEFEKREEW